ncbi:MAG: redoxin domain-containing protein [Planctomycetes bacterium]|nr:redoxin domain-containing protein [Planctomycetota bacterium]
MRQLVGLEGRRAELEAAGGVLAALSVDSPEDGVALLERLGREEGVALGFPLATDAGSRVSRAYGVHDERHGVAYPAVYIVGQDGQVVWRKVGSTVGDRPEVDEILAALRGATDG